MEQIKATFNKSIKELYALDLEVDLVRPDPDFGDFACNIALQLSKQLNQSPRQIAEEIVSQVKHTPVISSVNIAGPGFINIFVEDSVLLDLAIETFVKKNKQKIVIETNNPNPFKAMHIGHAFNAIVADTVANLLQASGVEVHRVSYHGDVGVHVGKSMYSILKFINGNPKKLNSIAKNERNTFMSRMYAEGALAYKSIQEAKAKIESLAIQSFTQEDEIFKEVYDECLNWSFEEIDGLVHELGNRPIEKRYLESQAEDLGVKTVKEHTGDVFFESEGALVFPGEKYGTFNNVFVGSNGFGLYGARDLGLMQLKNIDFNPDKSYIVTAEEQKDYFKGVIKAAELCMPDLAGVTVNIPTGTVKLTSGKMSSRGGEVVEISWLFNQIKDAIKDQDQSIAKDIATAALRYQFLKVRIGSDIVFDINEATNLQGNSGPYLQYAYVRAISIIKKSSQKPVLPENLDINERRLILKISENNSVIEKSIKGLAPHILANYLYELTQEFNRFYENSQIIGEKREPQRLWLLKVYKNNLEQGLKILGLPILQKM